MIELVTATLNDLPVMQAMGGYYVYDMSEFLGDLPGWEFPDTGRYECDDLGPYFENPKAHPLFIRVSGEMAGFAIVDDKGNDPEVEFNMGQFFVHRKFKGRGVGAHVAMTCFRQYRGVWNVMVIPGNRAAHEFWHRVINAFTNAVFSESRCRVLHLGNSEQDVFKFRTG